MENQLWSNVDEFEMNLNLTYKEFEDLVKLDYPGIRLNERPDNITHFKFSSVVGDITVISPYKPTHLKGIIKIWGLRKFAETWTELFVNRYEKRYPVPPTAYKQEPKRKSGSPGLERSELVRRVAMAQEGEEIRARDSKNDGKKSPKM